MISGHSHQEIPEVRCMRRDCIGIVDSRKRILGKEKEYLDTGIPFLCDVYYNLR